MTGEDPCHWVRLPLGTDDDALRQARRFVRLQAEQCGLDEDRGDAVTQAMAELLHAGGADRRLLAIEVSEAPDGIVIGVDVAGRQEVVPPESTRALLAGLSSDWGWEPVEDGVRIWCHLTRHAADGPSVP